MKTYHSLSEYLIEYKECNSQNMYVPVAVGKYGIRQRDEIYSKVLSWNSSKNKLIYKNTLTVGMGSSQIDIGVLDEDKIYSVSPAYHTYKIRNIDSKYLSYCLEYRNHDMFERYVRRGSRQGKSIDFKQWLKYQIPVYDVANQNEIVYMLDKIRNLINCCSRIIERSDLLVKSQFVELFKNETNVTTVADSCTVHARIGWQSLTKAEHESVGDYFLVTGTDFDDGKINWSTCCYVSKERYNMDQKLILKVDDILITKDGSIGKVAMVDFLPKPATLNAGVFVVRPKYNLFNNEYISYVFKGSLFGDFIEKEKTGATIKHLNQGHLLKFSFPLPPTSKQEEFSTFIHQIDKSKHRVRQLQEKLEMLYGALLQEYFG